MKKEMQQLRANLFLMRKNVKRVPRQGSAVSASAGTRVKLEQQEDSSQPAEPDTGNANVLALPNIKDKKSQKRPGSTQNRRDEDDMQPPPIIPNASEEVKGKRRGSFHVKIIKNNKVDHEEKERKRQE